MPQQGVQTIMDAAEDLGTNFVDTADIYIKGRSEETLGKALKGRWDRFVLASKFSMHMGDGQNDWGTSRYHRMHAVEASLLRLQNDHIDLYSVHRWDDLTPAEEMLRGFDDLIPMGKVIFSES